MNNPGKIIAVPDVAAPVLSQAAPAPADSDAGSGPRPADVPIALSQLASVGWSETMPLPFR